MIDVVIRVQNVTGPDGRPLDEHEADRLAQALRAGVAGALKSMSYTADDAKVTREPVPLEQRADRHDPTAGELAHIDAQADGARRRAWHEDEQL